MMFTPRRMYVPSLTDTIEPDNSAIPGQIVKVTKQQGGEFAIQSLNGKDLGVVCVDSLKPIPRKLKYDPETGLTDQARQRIC